MVRDGEDARGAVGRRCVVSGQVKVAIADFGGPVPAVVQMREGETRQDALDRLDAECAANARAEGGFAALLVCDGCDRPTWICRDDPATHERRKAKKAGIKRLP